MPTSYDAGTATSSYRLSLTGLEQDIARGKALLRELQEEARRTRESFTGSSAGGEGSGGVPAPRNRPSRSTSLDRQRDSEIRAAVATRDYARALALTDDALSQVNQGTVRHNQLVSLQAGIQRQAATANERTARSINQTGDSEIRAAAASRDYGRALALVDQQLVRAQQGSTRYNQLLARQATLQQQAERAAKSATIGAEFKASPLAGLGQAAGALGIGFGLQQVTQYGIEAVKARGELARVDNTTRLLTGTQRAYNDAIALARQNQELYGGSLAENIGNLTGFAVAARRSKVEISTLNDLAQRLAILSPEQGAEGASIAINEALSGNASSLVRRFEIPRELLKGISDESKTAAERLAILDDALTRSGVSSAVVQDAVDETTRSINRAGAAFDDLKTASGEALAPTVELASRGLERIIRAAQGSSAEIVKLKAALSGGTFTQADIDAEELYRQRQRVSGKIADTATGAGPNNPVGSLLSATFGAGDRELYNQLAPLRDRLAELAAQGPEAAQGVDQLFALLQQRKITVDEFITRLSALEQIQRNAAAASAASTPAYIQFGQAVDAAKQAAEEQAEQLRESLTDQVNARTETERIAKAQKLLADLGEQVAAGLRTSGDAAAILQAQYGFTASQAERLINAQAALAKVPPPDPRGEAIGLQRQNAEDIRAIKAQQEADLKAARQAEIEANETSAQRVRRLRSELAALNPQSAEFVRKRTEVRQAEKALAAEQEAAASRAASQGQQVASQRQRQLEAEQKAAFDLLTTEQQLLEKRAELGRLNPKSLEYKQTLAEIRDLEAKVADEQERQAKALVDARLAALDDRKQRRSEARELAAAQRVLASGDTSAEQKAAARDVLERIPLEQAKRQLEIAAKQRDAGGATTATALPSTAQQAAEAGARQRAGLAPLTPPPLPGAALVGAAGGAAAAAAVINLQVLLDGKEISAQLAGDVGKGVIINLRSGFEAAKSANGGD